MKHIQGKKTLGYIVLLIKGAHIESFLERCVSEDIPIWDVKQCNNKNEYQISIYLHDYKNIKRVNKSFKEQYEIKVVKRRGLFAFFLRQIKRKHIIVAFLISCFTLFLLSNVIWSVNINGVSLEVEEKIIKELRKNGVHVGTFSFGLTNVQTMQQEMINQIPELLWIGIEKKGTSFHIEGVEKRIVEEQKEKQPQHLIAKKNGVIENMYVRQGLPLVKKNDYVKKGDLLVSGMIKKEEELEKDEDKEEVIEPIAADGEIFANTWYEVNLSIPLQTEYMTLTGNHKKNFKLNISRFFLPIWGLKKGDYKNVYKELNTENLYFLKWKLPFKLVTETNHEVRKHTVKRNKAEAIQLGIKQVEANLIRELGEDAKILSNFTLHEALDSGKVNLNLYVSVLENIALEQQIK